MPTNFMSRLMTANETLLFLRDIQNDLILSRMLAATDNQMQLLLDREQTEINLRFAEVQEEFNELAAIAALN